MLALLVHFAEATPYDLKQALTESIENFWPVPHTTFYAEPARMAAAGYLSERQEQHGRRRKLYSLTAGGRDALAAWAARTTAAPPQVRDEMLLKIFAGGDPEPLLRQRRAWHASKLADLSALTEDDTWRLEERGGPSCTLIAGIRYHQLSICVVDDYLDGLAARTEPAVE